MTSNHDAPGFSRKSPRRVPEAAAGSTPGVHGLYGRAKKMYRESYRDGEIPIFEFLLTSFYFLRPAFKPPYRPMCCLQPAAPPNFQFGWISLSFSRSFMQLFQRRLDDLLSQSGAEIFRQLQLLNELRAPAGLHAVLRMVLFLMKAPDIVFEMFRHIFSGEPHAQCMFPAKRELAMTSPRRASKPCAMQ